ncbi:MAG: adenylate/guanylate cyclase domain-containing protein [Nitrososphaeraceae archaeon]
MITTVMLVVAEEISFTGGSQNCCVCFIDIVDSTRITTFEITDPQKIKRYYSTFINTMAALARDFDATVIKNTGDSVIFYFPKTTDFSTNMSAFKNVFECGLTMISVNPIINVKLQKEEGLPNLSYRISADYGRVEIAKSLTSTSEDLFGPTVNLCAKINSRAEPNGMVIGNNLYQVTKTKFDHLYHFNKIDGYSIDNSDNKYSVYSIVSKDKNSNDKKLNQYKDIM